MATSSRHKGRFFELFDDMVLAWQRGDQAEVDRLHEILLPHMAASCPVCMDETPPRYFYCCMDTPEEAALWSAYLDRTLFPPDYVKFYLA